MFPGIDREQSNNLTSQNNALHWYREIFKSYFNNFFLWSTIDLKHVLVSGIQQSDSVIYVCLYFLDYF